jgi:uncharacterized protein GlcG (DUF336 family)
LGSTFRERPAALPLADGAGLAGIDIALGKARAALTFGCS